MGSRASSGDSVAGSRLLRRRPSLGKNALSRGRWFAAAYAARGAGLRVPA